MIPPTPSDISAIIDAVYRTDWGRIVATLIRLIGDFDRALALVANESERRFLERRLHQVQSGVASPHKPS